MNSYCQILFLNIETIEIPIWFANSTILQSLKELKYKLLLGP